MPERANPSALDIIARFVVVIVLIVLAFNQWTLSKRLGEVEATLATQQAQRASAASEQLRKETERAEIQQRTYFPPNTFSKDPARDRALADAFSRPLRAMRADSLWTQAQQPAAADEYRLTWLASGHPLSLVIYPAGKGYYRIKKAELVGPITEEPGQLTNVIDYSLSPERMQEFFDRVAKANLKDMPAVNEGAEPTTPQSIFEWIDKEHKYHVVVVVHTDQGPEAYRELTSYVLARAEYERGGAPAKKDGAPGKKGGARAKKKS